MHLCELRQREDLDWVVDRVALGDRVLVNAGGFRRPRHHGLGATQAFCALELRLAETGARVQLGRCGNRVVDLFRGRTALVLPCPGDKGDAAGLREPVRPLPTKPNIAVERFCSVIAEFY